MLLLGDNPEAACVYKWVGFSLQKQGGTIEYRRYPRTTDEIPEFFVGRCSTSDGSVSLWAGTLHRLGRNFF
jgi:hypothetical protein